MTGRRLYEKYTDALKACETTRWVAARSQYERTYPAIKPIAWAFLSERERKTWSLLAKKIAPRPRKSPAKTAFLMTGYDDNKKIVAIKGIRALTKLGLKESKELSEALPATLPLPADITPEAVRKCLDFHGIQFTELKL